MMRRIFISPYVAYLLYYFGCGISDAENVPTEPSATVVTPETVLPRICDAGRKGLLFPIYDDEYKWHDIPRGCCYAAGLCYCFLGVSMIAEIFMSSIEAITSRRKQVLVGPGKVRTVFVWNDTVASLSLMALGSSAPEIFLSIIDLVRRGMYAGDLGPSTIVGSAAFNLLVIVAVCVACIPYPENRQVEETEVFFLTAVFSVIAYLWMAFILTLSSPDVIEWWEALITLLFLPVLIWMSYKVDVGGWAGLLGLCWPERQERREEAYSESKPRSFSELGAKASRGYSMDSCTSAVSFATTHSDKSSASTVSGVPRGGRAQLNRRRSIAEFHMLAMSNMPGRALRESKNGNQARRSWRTSVNESTPNFDGNSSSSRSSPDSGRGNPTLQRGASADSAEKFSNSFSQADSPIVQMLVDRQVMHEDLQHKVVTVCRREELGYGLRVFYKIELLEETHVLPTQCRGAYDIREADVPHKNVAHLPKPKIAEVLGYGHVDIPIGEFVKDFAVTIPKTERSCKDFLVTLRNAELLLPAADECSDGEKIIQHDKKVMIGPILSTQVDVIPGRGRDTGQLGFITQAITVPGQADGRTLQIIVVRKGGCSGTVSCAYFTEALDAVVDYDYRDTSGSLTFGEGVTEQLIELDILGKSEGRGTYKFMLFLKSSLDSCRFDPAEDGGDDSAILTVTISSREDGNGTLGRTFDTWFNACQIRVANNEWKESFTSILYCNGSPEEQKDASLQDWAVHITCLPWKILFLCVPPTTYFGGWLCFYGSLIVIALITGIIADFAELFGCIVGIGDMMTAITFVALGTSMPDLFASKVAATEDETADASIVNVTGSNAVNVFLGLGLPWTAATIYWGLRTELRSEWADEYPEIAEVYTVGCMFVVPSGNLGFCVLVFSGFALLSLFVLVVRRRNLGAELGGPIVPKALTSFAFVFMWIGYVSLVMWRYARWEKAEISEVFLVLVSVAVVEVLVASSVVVAVLRTDMPKYVAELKAHEAALAAKAKQEAEAEIAKEERASLKQLTAGDATGLKSESKTACLATDKEEAWTAVTEPNGAKISFEQKIVPGVAPLNNQSSYLSWDVQQDASVRLDDDAIVQDYEAGTTTSAATSSLAKIIVEPVPTESKAVLPHGLMESSAFRQEATDSPDADDSLGKEQANHANPFGPKLVPKGLCAQLIDVAAA